MSDLQSLYLPLNSLTILIGISVAVIQYLFVNYQSNIKTMLVDTKKITFREDNNHEQQLKARWDIVIAQCKRHSYIINPNTLIFLLFALMIVLLSILYLLMFLPNLYIFLDIDIYIIIIAISLLSTALIILLILSFFVLNQMINKENWCKKEFQEIKEKHDLTISILDSR